MNKINKSSDFIPANTIKNRSIEWAIANHIAIGEVTIVAGPRKVGKSLLVAHLIACFTNNKPFAPGVHVDRKAQGGALLYNGERSIEAFAKPRCAAAGADTSKVYIKDGIYSLDEVIEDIRKAPADIRLIIIDPLNAYAEPAHMSNKAVRLSLARLAVMARQRNACIIFVHHVTVRGRRFTDPTDFIQGKRVWIEAPFAVWMLCKLNCGFILEQVASNKVAGQKYDYVIEHLTLADGTDTERIDVLGESKHNILKALNGQAQLMVVKSSLERALEWLQDYLRDGPRLRNDVLADGEGAGNTEPTLKRAKQQGAIEDRKRRGDGRSEWFLPQVQENAPSDATGATGSSGSSDTAAAKVCYTPKVVMDAIHEVLGPCALDPASPARPVHVRTAKWFTQELDGLAQSWRISADSWLFLNPPWNGALGEPKPIPLFVAKLLSEMNCGDVPRAIVVLPFKTSESLDKLKNAGAALLNLGRLKYGEFSNTSRDDTACCLLGFSKHQVDALVASLRRHGVRRVDVERYGTAGGAGLI
jgi:AAA domain